MVRKSATSAIASPSTSAEPRIAEIATARRGIAKQSSPTASGSHSITWITAARPLPDHELTSRK